MSGEHEQPEANIKGSLHDAHDHRILHENTDEQGQQILSMNYPVGLLEKIS